MKLMPRSVRTELMLLTGLLLAAIAGFMLLYFPARIERQALVGLRNKARAMADMAAYSVAPGVVFGDTVAIREGLIGIQANRDLRYVVVRSVDGAIIHAYGLVDPASPRLDGVSPDRTVYGAQAAIRHNDAPYGSLEIGVSLAPLHADVDAARRAIAIASALVFVLGLAIMAAISVMVTRPLRAIAATADRVAAGRLEERAQIEGHEEIQQLAGALNAMLARITEAQAQLAMANRHLEDRVIERTAELSRAKQQLEVSLEAAQAASRAKSEFLANMSHEIRTPMNGVLGMLELVLDSEIGTQQRDYLETARTSADALLTIINDILDFSKIEARMMTLDPVDFDPRDLVETTLSGLAIRADKKGLEFITSVDQAVPGILVGDAGRLRQILVNLAGNAVKFTVVGQVEVRLSVERMEGDAVVLHGLVADTGIGIPAEKQHLIFDAFSQADSSTTRMFGGTGLGLAISSQLVQLMNGRIWVERGVERGSRFHFTVELRRSANALEPSEPVHDLVGVPALIVDDNGTNREVLREMLAGWGMRAFAVAGADPAMVELEASMTRGSPFPLMLVDANMPGQDGFQLVERMRARPELAQTAVMVLTSIHDPRAGERSRQLNITDVLSKPVRRSELLLAIRRALSQDAGRPAVARERMDRAVRSLHILLAEDNPVNQKVAVGMLNKRGHGVQIANNGREAVEAFQAEQFDLVLMDMQMPEMSGYEAAAAIRQLEQRSGGHIPIIALTAHAMKGDREKCLAAGMDGYISKPFRLPDLLEVIEKVPGNERAAMTPVPVPASYEDRALLERFVGDVDLLCGVAEVFLESEPGLRARLRDAVAAGDPVRIASAAHSIKGSVGNFGATVPQEASSLLEVMGREKDIAAAGPVYARLERGLDELRAQLERVLLTHRVSGAWRGDQAMSTGEAPIR